MRAYIGLGSNLDDPHAQLQRAAMALSRLPGSALLALSPCYRSPALRRPGDDRPQPDYLNAVALLETALAPLALLDALQAIELAQGRVRTERWGPRTLDLDLLLYGDLHMRSPRLDIPHPHLVHRRFVLQPLHDLAPALQLPDGTAVAAALARCAEPALQPAGTLALPA